MGQFGKGREGKTYRRAAGAKVARKVMKKLTQESCRQHVITRPQRGKEAADQWPSRGGPCVSHMTCAPMASGYGCPFTPALLGNTDAFLVWHKQNRPRQGLGGREDVNSKEDRGWD